LERFECIVEVEALGITDRAQNVGVRKDKVEEEASNELRSRIRVSAGILDRGGRVMGGRRRRKVSAEPPIYTIFC